MEIDYPVFLEFTITEKDIDSARMAEFHHNNETSHWCPVTLALARRLHRKRNSFCVGFDRLWYTNSRGKRCMYSLPENLIKFIAEFDMRLPVKSQTFQIVWIGTVLNN